MRYEAATTVAKGCQPGARELIYYSSRFGLSNVGCFNNRSVRGSTTLSLHAEGRAIDFTVGTATDSVLTTFLHTLISHYEPLGVQQIIWQRRSWRCDRTGDKWRPYSGVDPHTGHAHLELTRSAAAGLTVAIIESVLEVPPPIHLPAPLDDLEDDMPKYVATTTPTLDGKGEFRIYELIRETAPPFSLRKRHIASVEQNALRLDVMNPRHGIEARDWGDLAPITDAV